MHCEFGSLLDDALRDRFVRGLRSEASQRKLVLEAKLTFSRAVKIAQIIETAAIKRRQLHEGDDVGAEAKNHTTPTATGVAIVTISLPKVVFNRWTGLLD